MGGGAGAGGGGRSSIQKGKGAGGLKVGQFGQYVLGKHLRKEGPEVECFHATQKLLDREVEVHILRTPKQSNPALFRRFRAQVEAVAGIDHPGLLRILDVDTVGSRAFFTTHPRDCVPVSDAMREAGGALPATDVLEYAVTLAGMLETLHAEGIQVRALDIDRLFLDRAKGQVYLGVLDLEKEDGVLRAKEDPELRPLAGQLRDERTDIWLLARALYRMIVGREPFPPQGAGGAMARPLTEALKAGVWIPGFDECLLEALSISPSDRPESAAEWRARLDHVAREMRMSLSEKVIVMQRRAAEKRASTRRERAITVEDAMPDEAVTLPAMGRAAGARRRGQRPPPSGGALKAATKALAVAVGLASVVVLVKARPQPAVPDAEVPVRERRLSPEQRAAAREREQDATDAFELVAHQVGLRPTSRRTFASRWQALNAWMATPAGRKAGVATATEMLRLKMRAARGDREAVRTLDGWIRRARDGAEQPEG